MRRTKIAGFILAGILAIVPLTAFGHGFGGGGGHSGGGGHFSGGGGHFSGGAHFAGFTGHHFGFHGDGHFARHNYGYGGYYYPYGYGIDDYDYNDGDDADYSDNQVAPVEIAPFTATIVAVQKELTQLGYYHGPIDGLTGPQTETAVRWFQSVDKLPITGQVDIQTLKALGIS